jgi:hypothetical protein
MYTGRKGLILGFHGCDLDVAKRIVALEDELKPSENEWDWLGHGMYFWEYNYDRALDFARELKAHPQRSKHPINTPAVLGAVIDLGRCLDLLDHQHLQLVKEGFKLYTQTVDESDWKKNKTDKHTSELLQRDLDCAVIESIHASITKLNKPPFDSVRSVFMEGKALYEGAGFREKNHIQICVRNPNCIKGFFLPRELNSAFANV